MLGAALSGTVLGGSIVSKGACLRGTEVGAVRYNTHVCNSCHACHLEVVTTFDCGFV